MTAQNSSLHRKTLEILSQTPPFTRTRVLEEVAVSELFPSYNNNRDRYDIVLPDFKCVIELHGIQHFKLQTFGADAGEALIAFKAQQYRDAQKKEIALLHGWTYIEIPYTDEKRLNSDYLLQAYNNNVSEAKVTFTKEEKKSNPASEHYKELQRERARAYRKAQYRRAKELRRKGLNNGD